MPKQSRKPAVKCFAINDGIDGIWSMDQLAESAVELDPPFVEWMASAKAGDEWSGIGEKCTCIGLSRDY